MNKPIILLTAKDDKTNIIQIHNLDIIVKNRLGCDVYIAIFNKPYVTRKWWEVWK